jgi:hypothetical protein
MKKRKVQCVKHHPLVPFTSLTLQSLFCFVLPALMYKANASRTFAGMVERIFKGRFTPTDTTDFYVKWITVSYGSFPQRLHF